MKAVGLFFTKHEYRNSYIIAGLIAAASYYFMRELFISQSAWSFIITSQLTFTIVILFGLWGGLHHLIIPVKSPTWNVVVLVGGFVAIVIILKVAGMKTIFG